MRENFCAQYIFFYIYLPLVCFRWLASGVAFRFGFSFRSTVSRSSFTWCGVTSFLPSRSSLFSVGEMHGLELISADELGRNSVGEQFSA